MVSENKIALYNLSSLATFIDIFLDGKAKCRNYSWQN